MKKNLLKSLAFAAITTLSFAPVAAQTAAGPSPIWAKIVDTPNADMAVATAVNDKAVYTYFRPGIKKATDGISYDGKEISVGGFDMIGNSTNNNFLLTKSDRDGNLLWSINSTFGDFYNSGTIANTHDGGALVGFTFRHTNGMLTEKIGFKDAKGKTTEFDWTLPETGKRYDKAAVMKVSAEGEIEWIRTISPDGTYPFATGDVQIAGLAESEDNSLYVAAQFCDTITVDTPDGSEAKTYYPSNEQGGNALIAKYSANGDLLKVVTSTSSNAVSENIGGLRYADGNLYTFGYVKGNADAAAQYNFGEGLAPVEVPDSAVYNLVASKFNTDLVPQWTRLFPGSKVNKSSIIQLRGIDVAGTDVFLTGNIRGQIKGDNNEVTFATAADQKLYEGFIARVSADNGDLLAGTTSSVDYGNKGIAGYSNALVFSGKPNTVYAYGYELSGNLYLRAYDRQTLAAVADGQWDLAKGVSSLQNITASGDTLFSLFRVQNGNSSLTDGTALNAEAYGAALVAFKLPAGTVTGIASTLADNVVSLSAARGSLTITATKPQVVTVYAADGRTVANVSVNGTATVALPAGIYVAAGQKAVVK